MFAGADDAAQKLVRLLQARGVQVIAGQTAAEMRICSTMLNAAASDQEQEGFTVTELVGTWSGAISSGQWAGASSYTADGASWRAVVSGAVLVIDEL